MRHPPCPSYDVPTRAELAREAMDEARAGAEQEGYDRGHEEGYRRAWSEAMDAILVAMRECIRVPVDGYSSPSDWPRALCRSILEYMDGQHMDVPSPDLLDAEVTND